ncbi:hypothetical protein EF918_17275 [Streptomyces sp. WAC06614]|nr:hypothetical protein EF918_17275 [Streptomyces sp. WAC06614]
MLVGGHRWPSVAIGVRGPEGQGGGPVRPGGTPPPSQGVRTGAARGPAREELLDDRRARRCRPPGRRAVQRQSIGTAGRIENSQVAVHLVHASAAGHAAIDRRLHIPRSWTQDPQRCRSVGIPDDLRFAKRYAGEAGSSPTGISATALRSGRSIPGTGPHR